MKIAQRIGNVPFQSEENYQELVQFLTKHKACIDEITIFTRGSHAAMFLLTLFVKM